MAEGIDKWGVGIISPSGISLGFSYPIAVLWFRLHGVYNFMNGTSVGGVPNVSTHATL